ncbi:deoxyribodipyrimidine photolyase [Algoriphagus aestuarii]|nr:deoxyribodipyrimidine photolyase [Algoriphagus aestuarii]
MQPFPTDLFAIEKRIQSINPVKYAASRNFKDGAVTRLSPYISRGVISTKQVFQYIQSLDLPWSACEKLIQELAWRDYWQQVWKAKGEGIFQDLKNEQKPINNHQIPSAIVQGKTEIEVVDQAIEELYQSGYMHNHMRMYVASICCNMAKSHWLNPAKWMYSHLLDGDLASNHLSWQWVAGAFSNKKYFANQANINKYFQSNQQGTFLDLSYEEFDSLKTPELLLETEGFELETELPPIQQPILERSKKTLIYTYYNLDPYWYKGEDFQRILLLEPSVFRKYPVSQKCIDFALALSENIPEIQVFVGEFAELADMVDTNNLIFKEHPLCLHYQGRMESRDWLSSVEGYFPSFFAFWKKVKKEIAAT